MNIYITFTPYHILLSEIHKEREKGDELILIDATGNLAKYQNYKSYHGNKLEYIDASDKKIFFLDRARIKKSKIREIIKKHKYNEIKKIFLFNDENPTGQYILRSINRLEAKATYIEDGSAPYNSSKIKLGILKTIIRKLFYGAEYQSVDILGTSDLIDEGIFLFPEFIRKENKKKPFFEFEISLDKSKILEHMATSLGINQKSNEKALLLLAPHSNTACAELKKSISTEIEKYSNKGFIIFIKHHPLDKNTSEDKTLSKNTIELPSHWPAELIASKIEKIEVILGCNTTTLISIRKILPKIQTINISTKNKNDFALEEVMRKIGTKIIEAK